MDDTKVLRMLNLAKFDEKIHLYLGIQSEVASLRHTQDVGFVRVNAQPMKQAISTWITKWIYIFAQSLQDYVSSSLERMYSFISYTQKGLETPLSVRMLGSCPWDQVVPPHTVFKVELACLMKLSIVICMSHHQQALGMKVPNTRISVVGAAFPE